MEEQKESPKQHTVGSQEDKKKKIKKSWESAIDIDILSATYCVCDLVVF